MRSKYNLRDGVQLDDQLLAQMLTIMAEVSAQHAEALDRTIAQFYLTSCKTYPDLALSDLVLVEDSSKPLEVKIAVHPDAVLRHREHDEGEVMKPNKNGDVFDLSAEATYLETCKLMALGLDPLTLRESEASSVIAEKEGTMKQPALYTITINGVDVTRQVVVSSVRLTRDKPGELARACEFSLLNDVGQLTFFGPPSLASEEGTLHRQLWHSRSSRGKKLLVPTMHVLAHAEEDPMSVEAYEDERLVFEGHVARADAIHSTQTIYVRCSLGCVEKESAPSPLDASWALEAKNCQAYFNGTDAGYCLEGVVGWAKSNATFYPALDYDDLKYFTDVVWNDGACTVKVYHEDHEEVPYTLGSASGHSSKGTSTSLRRNLLFSGTVVYIGRSTHDEKRVVCCVVVDRAYPPPITAPVQKVEAESSLQRGLRELKEKLEKQVLMPSTMFRDDKFKEELLQECGGDPLEAMMQEVDRQLGEDLRSAEAQDAEVLKQGRTDAANKPFAETFKKLLSGTVPVPEHLLYMTSEEVCKKLGEAAQDDEILKQVMADAKPGAMYHPIGTSDIWVKQRQDPNSFEAHGLPAQGELHIWVKDGVQIVLNRTGDDALVLYLPDRMTGEPVQVLACKRWGEVEVKAAWQHKLNELAQAFWRAVAQVYHALPMPVSPKQEAILAFCNEHKMTLAEFDKHYYAIPTAGTQHSKATGEKIGPCWGIVKVEE